MTEHDVDLFHDDLLDAAARARFEARAKSDPDLASGVAFRAKLDDRLRAAFGSSPAGSSPEMQRIMAPPVELSRGNLTWFAIAAVALIAVVLGLLLTNAGESRETLAASELWKDLDPIRSCRSPKLTNDDQFANRCKIAHGAPLRIRTGTGATVHGPTKSVAAPNASLFAIILPTPQGATADIRLVLVGYGVDVEASGGIHAFQLTIKGIPLIELATRSTSRALALFY